MADKQNLAKKIDLNTKQDILIAGQNITIAADGKTISAANPTSVTVTPVYQAGTLVAAIVVNGNTTNIYAPAQHGDNANQNLAVSFNAAQTYEVGDYVIYQENLYQCITAIDTPAAWDSTKWTRALITDVMGQGSGGDYANQNIANTYSTASTYDVGDYVIFNGLLYKCVTAVTTPGSWNASYWEHCVVTDEMSGGGTNVIPNPQGEPTDTLETIQIGQTIFNIEGGGGSSYNEDILWSGTQVSTGEGVSISLSDNISDYDAIIIDCGRQSGSDYRHGYIWYPVSGLSIGSWYLQIVNTNDNCTAFWNYASNTSITWASAYSAYPVTLFSVKGVNFGGGGGGSFEGLDYNRAIDLTLPDYTGYTYTPTEPGAIITKSYGSVGSTRISFNDEEYSLAYMGDTWTTSWVLVPAIEITIKRGSSTGAYPSGSYIQFVPYKTGGGTGGGGNVDDVYVNGESVLDEDKIAQITSYREVTQAEYDALPASKESDNILYCIKDKATADTTVAPIIYSEEEREVGVWTDGKPLYQKTIVQHSTDTTGTFINVDVSALNIDNCVSIKGICDRIVPNIGILIYEFNSFENSTYNTYIAYSKFNNVIQYKIQFNSSGGESTSFQIFTLQYTKTTDTPGSSKYAPSGVPAVHYSENEQVVGTDTDGSTVYEITYVGDMNIPIQTWGGTGIYVSGNLISVDGYITRDGEPIPIGKFNTTVASSWILRDGEIKVQMTEYNTGEIYKLKRMTIRYTKTTS